MEVVVWEYCRVDASRGVSMAPLELDPTGLCALSVPFPSVSSWCCKKHRVDHCSLRQQELMIEQGSFLFPTFSLSGNVPPRLKEKVRRVSATGVSQKVGMDRVGWRTGANKGPGRLDRSTETARRDKGRRVSWGIPAASAKTWSPHSCLLPPAPCTLHPQDHNCQTSKEVQTTVLGRRETWTVLLGFQLQRSSFLQPSGHTARCSSLFSVVSQRIGGLEAAVAVQRPQRIAGSGRASPRMLPKMLSYLGRLGATGQTNRPLPPRNSVPPDGTRRGVGCSAHMPLLLVPRLTRLGIEGCRHRENTEIRVVVAP
ncbi:hypothetical protein VTI74DRAFT_2960 [Chaetomium olivicolor]